MFIISLMCTCFFLFFVQFSKVSYMTILKFVKYLFVTVADSVLLIAFLFFFSDGRWPDNCRPPVTNDGRRLEI